MKPAAILLAITLLAISPNGMAGPAEGATSSPGTGGRSQYYRCGPKGQDLRDSPCPPGVAGSAMELPEDRVSPDQQRAARQRTLQEARDLDALQRSRENAGAQRGAAPAAAGINGLTTLAPAAEAAARHAKDKTKPRPKPPPPPKAPKEPKPPKAPKAPKEPKEPKAPKEAKTPKAAKAANEAKEPKAPKPPKEAKASKESSDNDSPKPRRTKRPKDDADLSAPPA